MVIPSSIPCGDDTVWADVSPLLQSACNDLREGELIHGENFSLFAAMSALEIMDPKMDSGIESSGYHSVEEAIQSGAAPLPLSCHPTIDVQRTIDVMDHLFSCEATWHKGNSLAQTVFSCIYLLTIHRTSSHPLLHSYSRIIRSTCNALLSVVSDARTHDEEDLFTMAYGLPIKEDADDKCLSILTAVEETLSRQLRACKAHSSKKRLIQDIEPLQTNPDLEEGYCKALLCRLRFRKHFYHVLMCMRKSCGKGLELARKHIASCLSELRCIQDSSKFLTSVCGSSEVATEDVTTASSCKPIGFDASLNGRLSAPTPPRAIKILSWEKSMGYFQKLLHDLDILCSFSLDPSLEGILRFVVGFQKLQPDLVARSHLQLLLLQDGKLYGRDYIYNVIFRAAALHEAPKDQEIAKNEFVLQLGQLLINLLKILCSNAAWQRRKLGKVLQDWSVIAVQLELALKRDFGEILGTSVNENTCMKLSKHILIWTEEQTYWIAWRFLMLGFELQLYAPSDYCMVYWYIYVVLIKLSEKDGLKKMPSDAAVKRKGGKKRRDPQIPPSTLLLQCYMCLSEGLTLMLAALRNERNAFGRRNYFNTEEEVFNQHFDLLLRAHVPDHISYHLFRESTVNVCFSTLLEYNHFRDAQRIAKELRSSFANDPDRLTEVRQIEQIAEHNGVAVDLISKFGRIDTSLNVSFEFNHHPCFATALVKRA